MCVRPCLALPCLALRYGAEGPSVADHTPYWFKKGCTHNTCTDLHRQHTHLLTGTLGARTRAGTHARTEHTHTEHTQQTLHTHTHTCKHNMPTCLRERIGHTRMHAHTHTHTHTHANKEHTHTQQTLHIHTHTCMENTTTRSGTRGAHARTHRALTHNKLSTHIHTPALTTRPPACGDPWGAYTVMVAQPYLCTAPPLAPPCSAALCLP